MPMRITAPGEVPSTFAPSVGQQPLPMTPATSPWVRPMQNAAPGELQKTGQTLMQAGDTEAHIGNTIGDAVQTTMDDAQTKAAENQFLQPALQALGQYKTTEGINATQQFQPTAEAIVKARQDARATLANPIQQKMYDQVTNDHLLTFGAQMADHESTQRVQYGKQEGSDRADSMNVLARMAYLNGDMAGYKKYSGAADQETLGVAQMSGAAPDSDVAKAMLRAKCGNLTQGIVTGLIDRHGVNEADQYLSSVEGNIDIRTAEVLRSAIKSARMQEDPKIFGQQAIMAAKGITGPGVLQPPIPGGTITTTQGVDGIDVHAAQGTPVHAPASGTVTKLWNDETNGGGLTAQIDFGGGYAAQFNHLSAANYQAGQKITIGQVLGQTGRDDNGQGVMRYSMTGPDGKYIDPRTASSAPMDPKSFSSPEDEEKAVNWVNTNVADPETQKLTENYVRGIANTNRQIENQEHEAALKQATDYWFKNGESLANLPADVSERLTPTDIAGFSEKAKQQYLLNQSVLSEREVGLLANWDANPADMTVDHVRQAYAQGRLSNNSYLTALRQATAIQNGTQNAKQLSIDHDQLTNILAQNQLPNLAHPGIAGNPTASAANQLQRVQLEEAIKNEIDAQQQKNNRVLNWQEKGKIMRDMVIDKVYTSSPWYSGQTNQGLKPVAITTPDEQNKATVWIGNQSVRMMDIPPRYTVQAMQDLQTNGLPSTQANIAAWWLRKGKPTQ